MHIVKYLLKMKELDDRNSNNKHNRGLCVHEASHESGETPLHLAVSSGQYAVVKYLLINKADKM